MTMSPTLTDQALPWERDDASGRRALREEWQLVLAWSLDEPWRVGESAIVRDASLLGRGGPQPDDGLPRLLFHARRPGSAEPGPPLAATRVSRKQLRLTPTRDGRLEIATVGKCALLIDGEEVESAVVDPGAVITLKNALVLYVVREAPLEPLTTHHASGAELPVRTAGRVRRGRRESRDLAPS